MDADLVKEVAASCGGGNAVDEEAVEKLRLVVEGAQCVGVHSIGGTSLR